MEKFKKFLCRIWIALKNGFKKVVRFFAVIFGNCKKALIQMPLAFRAGILGGVGLALVAMVIVLIAVSVNKSPSARSAQADDPANLTTNNPISDNQQVLIDGQTPDATLIEPIEQPTATPHPLDGKVLEKGDSGELVMLVQERLMDLGYLDSDEPTDYFGSMTHDALATFQRHHELGSDGILGMATYDALFSLDAKVYVMQQGDSGDDVTDVQERLYQLGYLGKGLITGNFGEKTLAAVQEFQKANKLTADGKVGEKTVSKLYSDDVASNSFKHGDVDESIKRYQRRLVELGYLDSDFDANGVLNSATVSAIKNFQDANGLTRDGCLGPATMEALDSSSALSYALRLGMSGSEVKKAQQRLYKLGYLKSSQVTSYFGEQTQAAVESFQKRNSLTQDGAIGTKTSTKLYSDNAKKAASTSTTTPTPKPSGGGGSTTTTTPSNSKGVEKFIEIALSKVGCKYVRGAKGPNSFDCSGFVYWCLNQAGVKQGYLTSIGWRTVTKYKRITSMSDLKRGDVLVFSGSSSTGKGHVGIYLGDNKMVDAGSSKGEVVIRPSIKTSYWTSHFLMAYRIWD
ncbi:MAG: peptidoglycan-binding protein [Eubacteriales bacterium]|nr:peptidoglycan-binding protein [Eubacteriales bacterium]